jgi:hypothetical protein
MATGLAQLDRATGWVDQLVTYTVDESSNLLSRSNSFYMIVNVMGTLIDTKKIYAIEDVYLCDNYIFHVIMAGEGGPYDRVFRKKSELEARKVREELVIYWVGDQSEIPTIK